MNIIKRQVERKYTCMIKFLHIMLVMRGSLKDRKMAINESVKIKVNPKNISLSISC